MPRWRLLARHHRASRPEQGKHLKPRSPFTNGKKAGHKDWLVQQDWLRAAAPAGSAADSSRIATPPRSTKAPCTLALFTLRCPARSPRRVPRTTARRRFRRLRSPPQTPVPRHRETLQVQNTRSLRQSTGPDPKTSATHSANSPIRNAAPSSDGGDILAPSQDDPSSVPSATEALHRRSNSSARVPPAAPPSHDTPPCPPRGSRRRGEATPPVSPRPVSEVGASLRARRPPRPQPRPVSSHHPNASSSLGFFRHSSFVIRHSSFVSTHHSSIHQSSRL